MKKNILPLTFCLAALCLTGCRGKQTSDPTSSKDTVELNANTVPSSLDSVADQPDLPTQDKLNTIQRERTFRTNEQEEGYDNYLYCTNSLQVEWPEAIAHCGNIKPLQDSLLVHLFNAPRAKTFEKAAEYFLSRPLFLEFEINSPYKVINPNKIKYDEGTNKWRTHVSAELAMTSPELAVFRIMKSGYSGGAHGWYGATYLTFDKQASRIWSIQDAFLPQKRKQLLRLVNRRIEKRIKQNTALLPATALTTFYPNKQGITFVFQPYEVASYAEGIVEINVPYAELTGMLHPDFKACLQHSNRFHFLQKSSH